MTTAFYVKLYLLTIPIFFAVDLLWLGVVAKTLYRDQIGHLMADSANWPAAVVFYLVYIVGILLFAVVPALEKGDLQHAVIWGALFGFFTYATFELTSLAVLKDWPLKIVFIDIAWGVVLCTAVAAGSYGIGRWLQN